MASLRIPFGRLQMSYRLPSSTPLCPDEHIGYVRKIGENMFDFRYRNDYENRFVCAEYWKCYSEENSRENGITFGELGNPIVWGIESPHKEEYFSNSIPCFNGGITKCRPMNGQINGTAGFLFRENIIDVLKQLKIIEDDKWHAVIIANACRFQCSLGEMIKPEIRDNNFLSLFLGKNTEVNWKSFIYRIRMYNPYKLVLACTVGGKMVKERGKYPKKDVSFIKEWLLQNRPDFYMRIKEISLRGCVEFLLEKVKISFVSMPHPCCWHDSRCHKKIKRDVYHLRRKRQLPCRH